MRDSIGRRAVWILAATALAACDGADGVTGTGTDQTPRLTNHIVFAALVGKIDTWDIQAIDLDTNERIAITTGPELDVYPSVSPEGSLIAFSRASQGPDGTFGILQIYVTKADGSDPRPLTAMPGAATSPAWSPDGRRIAFAATDAAGLVEIWAISADGSELEQLTTGASPAAGNSQPTWSPDGSKIAYVFGGAGGSKLFVMDADGSDPVDLFGDFSQWAENPAWSPDGSHIAYTRLTSGGANVISQVRTDGSGRLDLTAGPQDTWPSWSPDGSQIAFARIVAGGPGPSNSEIVVSTANGIFAENVTQNLTRSPTEETWPHWISRR